MRPRFYIAIEPDLTRPKKWAVVLRDGEGALIESLTENLSRIEAERLLMPSRRAFMAGLAWMREDASSYVLSMNAEVICARTSKDTP